MQRFVTRATITREAARALVDAALDHARGKGIAVAVALVDRDGALMAFERMDGVRAPIVEFSIDKAYTAATTGASTRDFFAHMDANPALRLGLASRSRLLVWGGGVPAKADGEVIGGIGVSGASEEDDVACAQAALAACGLG